MKIEIPISQIGDAVVCKVLLSNSLLQRISIDTIGRKLSLEETKICLSEVNDSVDFGEIVSAMKNIIKLIEIKKYGNKQRG